MLVYKATVTVLLKADVCESEGEACDWFSGLLSENADVLDWGYLRKGDDWPPPALVEVPDDYDEGDGTA